MKGITIAFGKEPEEDDPKLAAAQEVMDAAKSDDAAAFSEALSAFVKTCISEYESESESEDEDTGEY